MDRNAVYLTTDSDLQFKIYIDLPIRNSRGFSVDFPCSSLSFPIPNRWIRSSQGSAQHTEKYSEDAKQLESAWAPLGLRKNWENME
jgi:hypothetical protein